MTDIDSITEENMDEVEIIFIQLICGEKIMGEVEEIDDVGFSVTGVLRIEDTDMGFNIVDYVPFCCEQSFDFQHDGIIASGPISLDLKKLYFAARLQGRTSSKVRKNTAKKGKPGSGSFFSDNDSGPLSRN